MAGGATTCSAGSTSVRCRTRREEFVESDCYVNFRPGPNWHGEYGFDWYRDGDFPLNGVPSIGSNQFVNIIGKQWRTIPPATAPAIDRDINFCDPATFVQDTGALFRSLKREYHEQEIRYADGHSVMNYASYLSLYINESTHSPAADRVPPPVRASIRVQVKDMVNTPPEAFEFECNPTYLNVQGTLPTAEGQYDNLITVECVQSFLHDQTIRVKAHYRNEAGALVKKTVGKLIVVANRRRKIKRVVAIAVTTPEMLRGSGLGERTGDIGGQLDRIKQSLHQANIDPIIENTTMNLVNEADFIPYMHGDSIIVYREHTYVFGTVTAYNATTGAMTVNVTDTSGTGTLDMAMVNRYRTAGTEGVSGSMLSGIPATARYDSICFDSIPVANGVINITVDPNLSYHVGHSVYISPVGDDISTVAWQTYLYQKLQEKLRADGEPENKYQSHFKVYCFGEEIGKIRRDGSYFALAGVSNGLSVAVGLGSNISTPAHEFLHSFELPHSFTASEADSDAHFSFKAKETENLMDYTHTRGGGDFSEARFGLYHWQWQIAYSHADHA